MTNTESTATGTTQGTGTDSTTDNPPPNNGSDNSSPENATTTSSTEKGVANSSPSDASVNAPSADPVVSVSDVGHRFGDLSVLVDISFTLDPGTVTAVVGPNGCGKTTLLRIMAGVLQPTSGRIERPSSSRPLGYLPQRPDFRPAFTIRETLEFYGALLPVQVDVQAALETVGLQAVADRRVDELSGGMRRLLGLAQATLGRPPLVLLDEPTGDLDPRMTEYMFDVIVDREAESTVLLATHNLSGAKHADQVIVIDGGHVVAHDSPDGIMAETGTDSFHDGFLELVGTEAVIGSGQEGSREP